MILQYTGNDAGWYYFFVNKEVYDELAAHEAYTQPGPEMQGLLNDRLRLEPERFEIYPAQENEYFHFKFRYRQALIPETGLPYRILYYRWDDEGYFYMVNADIFKKKTIPGAGTSVEQLFEAIPLAQEKQLLFELDAYPGKFELIKGTVHDFFYQKFRIKSM